MEKVGTFNGIVVFHYKFTNKEGHNIETTKALFNVGGMPVFVNSKAFNDKAIGNKVICDLAYDGSKWVVI